MDVFSLDQRSLNMSRIRSSGNKSTELRLIEIMRKNRITGWRRGSRLPGKPDFVFPAQRTAVFVDGDFWHGNPGRFRQPTTHADYWSVKIAGNKARDRKISRQLSRKGWRVIRLWESKLRHENAVIQRLRRTLEWQS